MANEIEHPSKILNPDSYKLIKTYSEDGSLNKYNVQVVDNELDPLDIKISWDEIIINTNDYHYITLDYHIMSYLSELMLDFKSEKLE